MVHAPEMIRTHPRGGMRKELIDCIEACFDCAQTCISCADACLGEAQVSSLIRCIRLNQDCAAICQATGSVLSRLTETEWTLVRRQLEACMEACRLCGEECSQHAMHMEHCRVCAEACQRCESACRSLLATV
jgi:hypothetical protein